MDKYLTVCEEAVDVLEEYMIDAANVAESSSEKKRINMLLIRLSKIISETKEELK